MVSLGLHDVNFPIRWWTWGSVQTSESLPLCYEQMDLWLLLLAWLAPWRGMHTNPDTTVLLIVPLWKSMMRGAMWSRCPCTAVSFELVWNDSKLGYLSLACADANRSLFWNLPFASLHITLAFNTHFWHLHFPHSTSLQLFYLYPS